MIPLHDSNRTSRVPVANRVLLAVNILVWLYTAALARQPSALEAFYERYSFDWAVFTHALSIGDISTATFVPLFAHMFVHGGWLHVIGNMLYLWIFGDNVEDQMGSAAYVVFYLLCGIVAAIGQGLVAPAPMVGASGAIAGVLGAYLVMFPTARVSTLVFLGIFISIFELPALLVIGMFVVLQVLEGVAELRMAGHPAAEDIAYFAHLFGFGAGIALLPFFRQRPTQRARFG